MELLDIIDNVVSEGVIKLTISKPKSEAKYKKVTVSKMDKGYFAEQFTEKQAFHKNIAKDDLATYLKEIA